MLFPLSIILDLSKDYYVQCRIDHDIAGNKPYDFLPALEEIMALQYLADSVRKVERKA